MKFEVIISLTIAREGSLTKPWTWADAAGLRGCPSPPSIIPMEAADAKDPTVRKKWMP